ncbi:MAG: tungstate ABC transporter substrate-binding protein WtpA [Campylobacterota bacterium]
MGKVFVIAVLATLCLQAKEKIVVFHAGSLAVPFSKIEKAFEKKYPQYEVQREASGSVAAARKISELGRAADVMASADYTVIDEVLRPQHARFNAHFATNEMAIAYTKDSKYADTINSRNWPEIFLKQEVKIGHSNPNLDPCGYRSMLVTKLAQQYYGHANLFEKLFGYGQSYQVGEEKKKNVIVRPKETDLLGLLEAGAYDYLFIYKSVAAQHGLKYFTLPDEISLKSSAYAKAYTNASFMIESKRPGHYRTISGAPMVYGITVAQNDKSPLNEKGAVLFVNFVLSDEGLAIMQEAGQGVIKPAKIDGDAGILQQ